MRYTQESLNKLLDINTEGEWMATSETVDTLELIGSIGNFPAKLTFPLPPDAYATDADFIAGLLASLEVIDFKPPLPGQLAVAAAPSGGARAQSGNSQPAQQSGGGGCPVHGTSKTKTGFRGNGFECGEWSDKQESWSKAGKQMNDGRVIYYCASKW